MAGGTDAGEPGGLDALAATLTARSGVRFAVAASAPEREAALALRLAAVAERGWAALGDPADELDEWDERAVHLVGWRDGRAVCAGRIVVPPGPLPTEAACGIVVPPPGGVADVGRMVVDPTQRRHDGGLFVVLLAALYAQVRVLGFATGCGMMARNVRALVRHLGVPLEVLGPERDHRGEQRAPVRFSVDEHGPSLLAGWR